MLPDAVRLRPKTPLAGDPLLEALRLDASLPFDIMSVSPRMTRYVNPNRLEPFTGKKVSDLRLRFYPHDLQDWLQHT